MRYDPVKQRAVFRNNITGRSLTLSSVSRAQAERFEVQACLLLMAIGLDEKIDQTRNTCGGNSQ